MLKKTVSKFLKAGFCLTAVLFLSVFTFAQKKNDKFQVHIKKTLSRVVIDGATNDQGWLDAEIASDFYMVLPMDTGMARVRNI